MNLSLFYRHPAPEYHSIELIFDTVSKYFPDEVNVKKVYAPHKSKGFIKRILIGLHARKNQGNVNHITGDIHFIAPFFKKNKTILTIHDIGSIKSGKFLKDIILKWFWFDIPLKSVAYVTVISEFTKQELLKHVKVNPEKVLVIPDCVSPKFQYKAKEFNTEKPVILQIGTKANKNLPRLIAALKDINCKLVIVGKLNNKQTQLLKEYKIEYQNYFDIPDEKLVQLYEQADIVSFVSTYEGFGMPVIEANAVGRLVITSDIEPMNTVAGDAALKVNPYDIADIRKGILQIIENEELRNRLITNGLKNTKKFLSENIAAQYFKIYQKVIQQINKKRS